MICGTFALAEMGTVGKVTELHPAPMIRSTLSLYASLVTLSTPTFGLHSASYAVILTFLPLIPPLALTSSNRASIAL